VQEQELQDAKQQPAGQQQQQQGLLLLVPLTLGVGKVRRKLLYNMIAMHTVCQSMVCSVCWLFLTLCAGLRSHFGAKVMDLLALFASSTPTLLLFCTAGE
jgi:hypothetical protein